MFPGCCSGQYLRVAPSDYALGSAFGRLTGRAFLPSTLRPACCLPRSGLDAKIRFFRIASFFLPGKGGFGFTPTIMPCSCDSSCRSRPSCSEPVPASPLPGGMRCCTLALGECGDGILPCNRSRMKKSGEKICGFQKWLYLCTRNTERGALVQLVRIRACHARGQGFESPTHRQREGQRRSYKSKSLVNE